MKNGLIKAFNPDLEVRNLEKEQNEFIVYKPFDKKKFNFNKLK